MFDLQESTYWQTEKGANFPHLGIVDTGILAMEPEYLILDEPVAGMDAPGKRMLFQLLHHLNKDKGITIVLVSHNMDDVAAHADRVLIMEDGTLKMDGTVF